MNTSVRFLVGLALTVMVVLAAAVGSGAGVPLGLGSGSGTAYAEVITGAWSSAFQVQNLSSVATVVQITYYDQNGTAVATQSVTINGNKSKTFMPGWAYDTDNDPSQQITQMKAPAGFNGSVQMSSQEKIAAIANINTATYSLADTYGGVTTPASKVILPIVQKQLGAQQWSTVIFVQNTTGVTVNATVTFYDAAGSTPGAQRATSPLTIPANGRASLDQSKDNPNLPSNWYGSAVITTGDSDQQVAAVVVQSNGQSIVSYPGLTDADSASTIYAPLIQNENDKCSYWTGLQVVNVSNVTTDIILQVGGAEVSRRTGIGQYQAANWLSPASNSGLVGKSQVLAGTFVASNPSAKLVGIVNLNRRDVYKCYPGATGDVSTGAPTLASGYRMFTQGAEQAFAPLIDYYNDGWWAGLQVMNVGSAATGVQLYVNGAAVGSKIQLDPGKPFTYYRPSDYGLTTTARFVGSASVRADSGGQIVGVISRQKFAAGSETALTYEASKP